MSRYVEVNKAMDLCIEFFFSEGTCSVENLFNSAPSIDIVRCGECKYWKSTVQMPNGTEVKCLYGRKADDFCSYGCREEERYVETD